MCQITSRHAYIFIPSCHGTHNLTGSENSAPVDYHIGLKLSALCSRAHAKYEISMSIYLDVGHWPDISRHAEATFRIACHFMCLP